MSYRIKKFIISLEDTIEATSQTDAINIFRERMFADGFSRREFIIKEIKN